MKAIVFKKSIPRYLLINMMRWSKRLTMLELVDIPQPSLPAANWVRLAPILAGICGSDIATAFAKGSPYFSPLTAVPFVLGHEVVATISHPGTGELPDGLAAGSRVVLQAALGCTAREIDPACEACRRRYERRC